MHSLLNLPHINGKIEYKQTRRALVECVMGPAEELPEKAVVVKDFNRRLSKIDSTTLRITKVLRELITARSRNAQQVMFV